MENAAIGRIIPLANLPGNRAQVLEIDFIGYHQRHTRTLLIMSKTTKTTAPKDFETALAELESLVATLEAGDLALEASLTAYKRGVELSRFCQQFLSQAEQQLAMLENDGLKPLLLDTAGDA